MRRNHVELALFFVSLIAAAGCGGSGPTVTVTGTLLKGGASYVPQDDHLVSVTFVALEIQDGSGKPIPSKELFSATVEQASGKFSVPGSQGLGIPPGKYRVAVTEKMKRESYNALKTPPNQKRIDRETDMLGKRFSSQNSPIIHEIKASCDLAIDLDTPADKPPPAAPVKKGTSQFND